MIKLSKETRFENLAVDDFNDFVGKRDVAKSLRKIYGDAIRQARVDLDALWGDGVFYRQHDEARKSLIRECYVELAEAEFAAKSFPILPSFPFSAPESRW